MLATVSSALMSVRYLYDAWADTLLTGNIWASHLQVVTALMLLKSMCTYVYIYKENILTFVSLFKDVILLMIWRHHWICHLRNWILHQHITHIHLTDIPMEDSVSVLHSVLLINLSKWCITLSSVQNNSISRVIICEMEKMPMSKCQFTLFVPSSIQHYMVVCFIFRTGINIKNVLHRIIPV